MNARLRAEIAQADRKGASLFFQAIKTFWSDWKDVEALDMFARNGELTVRHYVDFTDKLDVWDWNPSNIEPLQRFPVRRINVGCSFTALKTCPRQYDMVVCDSPQGMFHAEDGHDRVEHFEIVPQLHSILKDRSLVVLYVNKEPYDRGQVGHFGHDYAERYHFGSWMLARERFYGIKDGRYLTEQEALATYQAQFARHGLKIVNMMITPCITAGLPGMPPAFRLALELVR